MDSNASLIEQIMAKTNEQVEALTQKVQNLIDTGDLSNPAVMSQFQLFLGQLSVLSNLPSSIVKVYVDRCQSIIQRIGYTFPLFLRERGRVRVSAVLQQEIKRLLVEAAIAAPNYGLTMPAQGLLNALPALGLDRETKALTTAMIRFGLKKPRSALNALKASTMKMRVCCAKPLLNILKRWNAKGAPGWVNSGTQKARLDGLILFKNQGILMTIDISNLNVSPALLPKMLSETAPQSAAAAPSARQISDFAQWMNAARLQQSSEMLQKMPGSPIQAGAVAPPSDTALLGALQSQEQEIKKRFRSDTLSAAQDPAAALKVQGEVAMATLKLELLTKITNGITQGINKLTSMA